jgi:hypothetical protein
VHSVPASTGASEASMPSSAWWVQGRGSVGTDQRGSDVWPCRPLGMDVAAPPPMAIWTHRGFVPEPAGRSGGPLDALASQVAEADQDVSCWQRGGGALGVIKGQRRGGGQGAPPCGERAAADQPAAARTALAWVEVRVYQVVQDQHVQHGPRADRGQGAAVRRAGATAGGDHGAGKPGGARRGAVALVAAALPAPHPAMCPHQPCAPGHIL